MASSCQQLLLTPWRRTFAPSLPFQVWDVASQAPVLELHAKSVTKESWPLVQWGPADSAAFHAVTNTVQVYRRDDGFKGESGRRRAGEGVGRLAGGCVGRA